MGLGAAAKYGCKVKLIACGLNYFNPDSFRSKMIIQFGNPFEIG